jgi:predicted ATPase
LIEIAERGHEADDSEIMLQSLHCAWATDFNTGRYADCICRIDRALPFYDPQRAIRSRGRYGGHDAKVCALAERGLSLWFVGDIEHARSNVQAALDGAQQLDHPASLSHALDFALMLRRYENDFAGAAALASQWEEVADAHGLVGAQAKSQIFGGWALGMQGSLEEGLHKLEEGLAKQRATGTEEDLPVFLEMQAELLGRLSRPDKGIAVLGAAIERAERLGHMFWIPELYRRRALLRHMTGQARHLCIHDLERALAEAEGRGAKTLASRASENLAQLKSS